MWKTWRGSCRGRTFKSWANASRRWSTRSSRFGGSFDVDRKVREVDALEKELSLPEVWGDTARVRTLQQRKSRLVAGIEVANHLSRRLDDAQTFHELAREGEDVLDDLEAAVTGLAETVETTELSTLLTGSHDGANAIVEIHPGAGGTESQDWAEMLYRMYVRWAERRGFKVTTLDFQAGEEAGLKSATLAVAGANAYGYLKAERGVHRLVRISPFDAQARRHTSFASLDVIPEVQDDVDIVVEDKDLRVDTYRSSGAGGQHVNVTDSAVRITHLPTGIVVTCQNERSQHKNRDVAMKLLRSKLYQLEVEKRQEDQEKLEGEKKDIAFGSQIRSYVMQPYQMIKDLRTGYEVGDVQRVMDGDLDGFVEAYLAAGARRTAD